MYAAFDTDLKSGASEVYLHEMPGGQFTNLKEQARSLGLETRWHEVAQTYADVNQMFGDIIKVTPTSKVVGDMALAMVSAGLTRAEVEDPAVEVAFPESVVGLMKGEIGQPVGGFPEGIQTKVLKGEKPLKVRPGSVLKPVDMEAERAKVSKELGGREVDDEDLCGYLMYPKVFMDYMGRHRDYGPVRVLPTPVFLYGMDVLTEVDVEMEPGKTLSIRLQAIGETDEKGEVKAFFELNGQPRTVRIPNRKAGVEALRRPKAEDGNPNHVAAPMPGVVASVAVAEGQEVKAGDMLLTIEAMKMETAIHADRDGIIARVAAPAGSQIDAKDLLVEFAA
jgi:pyruvate carboxylase